MSAERADEWRAIARPLDWLVRRHFVAGSLSRISSQSKEYLAIFLFLQIMSGEVRVLGLNTLRPKRIGQVIYTNLSDNGREILVVAVSQDLQVG